MITKINEVTNNNCDTYFIITYCRYREIILTVKIPISKLQNDCNEVVMF